MGAIVLLALRRGFWVPGQQPVQCLSTFICLPWESHFPLQGPLWEDTWVRASRLQHIQEGEVCGDEGRVPRAEVTLVLLPHQAEGAQALGAAEAIHRHQLTLPAQLSHQALGAPQEQGRHAPGEARNNIIQGRIGELRAGLSWKHRRAKAGSPD